MHNNNRKKKTLNSLKISFSKERQSTNPTTLSLKAIQISPFRDSPFNLLIPPDFVELPH